MCKMNVLKFCPSCLVDGFYVQSVFQLKFSPYSRTQGKFFFFLNIREITFTQSLIKHPKYVLTEGNETQFKHMKPISL